VTPSKHQSPLKHVLTASTSKKSVAKPPPARRVHTAKSTRPNTSHGLACVSYGQIRGRRVGTEGARACIGMTPRSQTPKFSVDRPVANGVGSVESLLVPLSWRLPCVQTDIQNRHFQLARRVGAGAKPPVKGDLNAVQHTKHTEQMLLVFDFAHHLENW